MEFFFIFHGEICLINKVFATLNFLLASKETLEQQDKEFSLSGIKELKEKRLCPSDKNNCNINN
ncbi:hypothetical protein AV920_0203805 [Helicobacter pylori]|nr:hypothetical protein AV923_0203360 [Helicobacter pylori]OJZ98422.1 hypothetical protein AV920_0203805 [Helicobacter pylori]